LTTFDEKPIVPELVQRCLDPLRKVQAEGQVKLGLKSLYFESGQDLLDWVKETKTSLAANEIKQ